METLAPPVVAVVVAHEPGAWFEDTLASLGSQDYAELSVLVLDNGSAEDLTARVAAVAPTAYVRRFEERQGYAAVANEVRTMVEGAAYYLFCHDDVAPDPDAVHLLVEEAFRSNAGIVSPKVVGWDDPDQLLHVGLTADKAGSVVDRVQPHEIDHGQHDAVRDVFVAPGGCTLVRADLFEELDGFDPAIVAMGEDLDLCWRAQVAGARVVVAPAARVRHLELLAAGARPLDPAWTGAGDDGRPGPITLQGLQRRHELRAVLICYGRGHRLRVVPQVAVLDLGELVVAVLAGNRGRARAVAHAWRWNLTHLGEVRRRRRWVAAHRRLSDKEVRLLQLRGSARLSAYLRKVFQFGFHGAHADEIAMAEAAALADAEWASGDDLRADADLPGTVVAGEVTAGAAGAGAVTAGVGVAAAGPAGAVVPTPLTERGMVGGGVRLAAWVIAAVVLLIGTRGLLSGPIPTVGQFVPFPDWTGTFTQFFTGWHPAGVGTTAPAAPAFAVAGVVGTVLLGAMGLTQKVLLFACLPLGAWGMTRLLRPFGSQRACLVAGLAYLAVPVPYDDLALGRLGGLAVYAGAPWVLVHLFRWSGIAPYARSQPGRDGGAAGPGRDGRVAGGRRWLAGHRVLRACLVLGVLEALLVSFVPAAAVVVVVAGLAVAVSPLLLGGWARALRALALALGSTVVAGILCFPWLIGVLRAGRGAAAVLGTPTPVSEAASWGSLLRLGVGPIGDTPLTWGFALAALLPLLLGHGPRFRWAGRCWTIAMSFWVVAWVMGRGWTGTVAIDPLVLLAPAAAALAMAIGLGIAAFEEDLRATAFGWKQLATVLAALAVVAGTLPMLAAALPGRWELPQNSFGQTLDWMHPGATTGAFRVLWLGDARAVGVGSWAAGDGLAYATTADGTPDATWLWNPASPGPAGQIVSAVDQARAGSTDRLGAMLAPMGVRYVVLVTALAPEIPGVQSPTTYGVPADLTPALDRQLDLQSVFAESGITVYASTDWLPVRAAVAGHPPAAQAAAAVPAGTTGLPRATATPPGTRIVPGATAVLPAPATARSASGPVPAGTVLAALNPPAQWHLTDPSGRNAPATSSFGWAAQYRVAHPGPMTLRFESGPWAAAEVPLEVALWVLMALVLIERRRGAGGRLRALARRRRERAAGPDPIEGEDAPFEEDPAGGVVA